MRGRGKKGKIHISPPWRPKSCTLLNWTESCALILRARHQSHAPGAYKCHILPYLVNSTFFRRRRPHIFPDRTESCALILRARRLISAISCRIWWIPRCSENTAHIYSQIGQNVARQAPNKCPIWLMPRCLPPYQIECCAPILQARRLISAISCRIWWMLHCSAKTVYRVTVLIWPLRFFFLKNTWPRWLTNFLSN